MLRDLRIGGYVLIDLEYHYMPSKPYHCKNKIFIVIKKDVKMTKNIRIEEINIIGKCTKCGGLRDMVEGDISVSRQIGQFISNAN